MNFYYDNSSGNAGYKGIAAGYKGALTRIVTQTIKAPYAGLIPLNSPNSRTTLTGAFAQIYSGNIYITVGSTLGSLYYTTISNGNAATTATWKTITTPEPLAKTSFVLSGGYMLPVAIGSNTNKAYLFTNSLTNPPTFAIDTVNTFSIRKPFYELSEHGTVNSTDTLYTYGNNPSDYGLFSLQANGSGNELAMTAFSGTGISSKIVSVGYSSNGHIAGVDSAKGTILTESISGSSVSWTNVSNNIHPLTLYGVQAQTGISGSHTIVYATGLKGEVLYDSIASGNPAVELIPPTTRTLYDVGTVTGNSAILVGDSGTAYNFSGFRGTAISGFNPGYSKMAIPQPNNKPLFDIAVVGTTAYIAGAGGILYYVPSTSSASIDLAGSITTNDFVGIANNPSSSGGVIAVGSNNAMCMVGGTSVLPITQLYNPGFNAESFLNSNANEGYLVGDSATVRRTDDGGNTWQVVIPDLGSYVKAENYNTVWTTGVGKAIIAGNGNFIGTTNSSNQTNHFGSYSYGSSSQVWNKIRYNQNHLDSGYLVGASKGILTLLTLGGTLTGVSAFGTTLPATADLYSLHVFRDNSFIVGGTTGYIYYYNLHPTTIGGASPGWINATPTTASSHYTDWTVNDMYWRDDRTGYAVGDSNTTGGGFILKCQLPVNVMSLNPAITTGANPFAYFEEPVADGLNVTNVHQVNYNAIAFSGTYDGFVAGTYASGFSNSSIYPYARLVNDRGGQFSSLFWYDRLGRLIVSQNTKQYDYKKPAYTYTLYDALNRTIEVGQKTENTSSTKFSSIFGDTVLTSVPNPSVISPSKFLTWIRDNTGPRTEVTHTYYDVQDILPTKILVQNELRNRTAATTYTDTLRSDSLVFNNASYYSYDIHGNIQTLIQDDSVYNVGAGQRYKRLDYQYDLISNNVNEVDYQNDSLDAYHHRYMYDADNRITQVQTSKDSVNWDNDANYFYYAHGPLARTELGDQQVQGEDIAYTLQGWIKGVNSDKLTANNDMGKDAEQVSGNLNSGFARDAAGYTLKYFDHSKNPSGGEFPGDYDAIDTSTWNHVTKRFEALTYGSDLTNTRRDLFDGNISAMATNIQQPQAYSESTPTQTAILLPQGTAYGYDQINRLVEMKAFQNLDTTTNVWGTTGSYNGLYHNWLSYDANGNILTQKRADQYNNVFDSLTYHYNIDNGLTIQNRLYHVNDEITITVDGITNDIKDEGTFLNSDEHDITARNNYRYNSMGQLAKDSITGLDTIVWTTYGKVWKIKKHTGDSLIFAYDSKGDRLLKEYKPASGTPVSTYYIRDAQGNILSIYTQQTISSQMHFTLTERDIFGSKRIGSEKTSVELVGHLPVSMVDTFKRYLGNKEYELDNHLGNVLAVVTDRKIPRPDGSGNLHNFEADVISSNDYFGFGQLMPGRMFSSNGYRYGFNGKERLDEITGFTGTDYDYGARILDVRLGRFMSIDPISRRLASLTPYQYASNSPIEGIDIEGLEQGSSNTINFHNNQGLTLSIKTTNNEQMSLINKAVQEKYNSSQAKPAPEFVKQLFGGEEKASVQTTAKVGVSAKGITLGVQADTEGKKKFSVESEKAQNSGIAVNSKGESSVSLRGIEYSSSAKGDFDVSIPYLMSYSKTTEKVVVSREAEVLGLKTKVPTSDIYEKVTVEGSLFFRQGKIVDYFKNGVKMEHLTQEGVNIGVSGGIKGIKLLNLELDVKAYGKPQKSN